MPAMLGSPLLVLCPALSMSHVSFNYHCFSTRIVNNTTGFLMTTTLWTSGHLLSTPTDRAINSIRVCSTLARFQFHFTSVSGPWWCPACSTISRSFDETQVNVILPYVCDSQCFWEARRRSQPRFLPVHTRGSRNVDSSEVDAFIL